MTDSSVINLIIKYQSVLEIISNVTEKQPKKGHHAFGTVFFMAWLWLQDRPQQLLTPLHVASRMGHDQVVEATIPGRPR